MTPRRPAAQPAGLKVVAAAKPPALRRRRASVPAAAMPLLTPVLPRPPLDMALPGQDSPLRLIKQMKWRRARRFASRGLAVAMILVITLGGLLFSQSYLKLHKVFRGGAGTAAALKADVKPELLKGEGRGRINILLLGRGGGNHDAPDLTDTIMLASVDPVNHTTALLSIPRDLWVNVPGHGVMKLNAAWETGEFAYQGNGTPGSNDPKAVQAGFKLVDQTLEEILGIEIDYNLLVDFQAFKQAVDTVGGVNLNVPSDLVDPTMAWENSGNPLLAKAGQQAFNGNQALIYVRSRETTSDYARAERQRAVLVALKSKIVSLGTLSNPLKISGLLNAFGDNVQTDLSLTNANRLYSIVKGVEDNKVASISLADGSDPQVVGGNVNGQSVVLPKNGLFNYSGIQQFVRGQLKDPYILKENAKVLVLNGSSTLGAATAKANDLKSYGYNVIGTGNTPNPNWTNTTLFDLTGKNKYTRNYLQKRFGQQASAHLADSSIATNGADFVIIIGSNEALNTQP